MKIEVNIPEEWDDENGVQYVVSDTEEEPWHVAYRLVQYLAAIGIPLNSDTITRTDIAKAAQKRWVEYHAFFNEREEIWPEEYVHDEPYRNSILVYSWDAHQLEELGFKI